MAFGPKRKRPLKYDIDTLADVLRDRLQALVICISNSWGGLEQVAANDAVEMGRLGLKVSVLCYEGSPIHENLAHSKEVNLVPIQFQPRNYFDFKLRSELHRLVKEGVNLIHTHQTSLLGSVCPWFWYRDDVVILATRHIMNNHNKKNFFHGAIYRRLDALVVISHSVRQNVLDTHRIKEKNVRVINLGLDFTVFDPDRVNAKKQRSEWGADKDTVVIGLVGRIDPAKGQATFIKAAAGLMKKSNERKKLKFVIVGEQTLGRISKYLEALEEMVTQFRIEEHVVFAGYQENIPEVMRAFDVVVMPSTKEAFGLVAIEAMAMECPIVISSGGSAEEIVGKEEYGLLMRRNDAFDLQRQLRYLIDHPSERVKMGQKAREHVMHHYDKRGRVQKSLELYERSLRRRGL